MQNIKYFGFAKGQSAIPVFGYTLDKKLDEPLKLEIPKILLKLKELQIGFQQRQRIKSQYGVWFCKRDSKGFFYISLCENNYPQRHVYAMILQLKEHLDKLGDYQTQAQATLKLHAKDKVIELSTKYNRPQQIDKIGKANKMLVQIKDDLTDSTRKMMQNHSNLQGLQTKASSLKQNALMFQQSAVQVQRQMWWRNCKMRIIIGIVVVILICVIVIPIAVTVNKK